MLFVQNCRLGTVFLLLGDNLKFSLIVSPFLGKETNYGQNAPRERRKKQIMARRPLAKGERNKLVPDLYPFSGVHSEWTVLEWTGCPLGGSPGVAEWWETRVSRVSGVTLPPVCARAYDLMEILRHAE